MTDNTDAPTTPTKQTQEPPAHWLLKDEDITNPLISARDTLQFMTDTINAFALAALQTEEPVTFSVTSWEILLGVIEKARQDVDGALGRVREIPGDLLVMDQRFQALDIYKLWKDRQQHEAQTDK